ncbi:unnamed protein product [Dicrocoelium dendriticum]|nr:unnamed protein product [Dicrocoelium dendriticum]CAH8491530.1 unnamed protein product [Dicrocoelium dendriticum]
MRELADRESAEGTVRLRTLKSGETADDSSTNHYRPNQRINHVGSKYIKLGEQKTDEPSVNKTVAEDWVLEQLVDETRRKLMVQFEKQLDTALNEFLDRANHKGVCVQTFKQQSMNMEDKSPPSVETKGKIFPEKVFRLRDSVLTELFELSHIRTVYHVFIAILLLFSFNLICTNFLGTQPSRAIDHLQMLQYTFGKFRDVMLFWVKMKASTMFIPFLGFFFWCTQRSPVTRPTLFDWVMLGLYVLYQVAFITVPIQFTIRHQLPPVSTFIVVLEQIRMLMKSHAFVRTCMSTVVEQTSKQTAGTQQPTPWTPNFSNYLYFLFAPTLVYRNTYPRTSEIRWGYVVSNLLQVCGCTLLSYYVLIQFCFTEFVHFGRTSDYTLRQFILTSTATSVPGGLVMFLIFFAGLHSWLNAFAEMLRFGDRLFYKDWWNSTAFSVWYRTWNVVVHDWLYTYVYKDIQLLSRSQRSRSIATAVVFWLSAAVHEYALSLAFRFFYPVLFVFFTFAGYPFFYVNGSGRSWNVFIWVVLFTGWGQLMCLYSMEWYARKNCLPVFNSWVDFMVPHSWFCRPIPTTVQA